MDQHDVAAALQIATEGCPEVPTSAARLTRWAAQLDVLTPDELHSAAREWRRRRGWLCVIPTPKILLRIAAEQRVGRIEMKRLRARLARIPSQGGIT